MLIPKTIHYVWLGRKPMHPLMDQWREGWARLHPNWDIKIWTEGTDDSELTNGSQTMRSLHPHMLEKCCHLSQRSNIWRYEIVEQFGGLYLDTDFEPSRNVEPLIEDKAVFAGKYHWIESSKQVMKASCALIGSVPHHPWLKDLVMNLEIKNPKQHGSLGNSYFTSITSQHPEVFLFEPHIFYPVRWDETDRYASPIPKTAYAVHRWSSRWFRQGFAPLATTP